MFKNLKQKIESEKNRKFGYPLEEEDGDDVNVNQQPDETSGHKQYHSGDISFSPSTINTINQPQTSDGTDKELMVDSRAQEEVDSEDDPEQLKVENKRLREQVDQLSKQLADLSNKKPVDLIVDEKLLKLVGELSKESDEVVEGKPLNKLDSQRNDSIQSTESIKSNTGLHQEELEYLKQRINELEESLREKNKTIRLQQQRINDIRKSFQKGSLLDGKLFDLPGSHSETETSPTSTANLDQSRVSSVPQSENRLNHRDKIDQRETNSKSPMNDISFQYLRSVMFKFVITSDYEAQKHLVKAISMLLQFSEAEEKQIRESLEQKLSWFKNLPILGNGFKANSLHTNSASSH